MAKKERTKQQATYKRIGSSCSTSDTSRVILKRHGHDIVIVLDTIVELLLFCLYMSVIPIKYVYTN
jgi:tetrahydromethanopterin S-methyltransferase subunit G